MELSSKILTSLIQLRNDIWTWVLTKGLSPNLAKQNFINKRYPMPCRVPQKLDLYWFDTVCLHNHLKEPRLNNGIKMIICFDLNLWQRNFYLDRTSISLYTPYLQAFFWFHLSKIEQMGSNLWSKTVFYRDLLWPLHLTLKLVQGQCTIFPQKALFMGSISQIGLRWKYIQ